MEPATDHVAQQPESGNHFWSAGVSDKNAADQLHALQALLNHIHGIDNVEIDTAGVQMSDDGLQFRATIRHGRFPVLGCFGNALVFEHRF